MRSEAGGMESGLGIEPMLDTRQSRTSPGRSLPALRTSTVLQTVLFAGLFILNFFVSTDPDMWWHMAAGRHLVETGAIPQVDPFSYTKAGQPWVAHEWLAEIIMYLLYRSGGYLVPVLFFASMITLTFWLTFRSLRLVGLRLAAASCITFWVAMMSLGGWNVRPQLFSYLFFALYLHLLLRSRERADRWLWSLPAIMLAWVNLHAGFVMGLLLVALFLMGEGINWVRDGRQRPAPSPEHPAPITHRPSSITRLAVAIATLAATVANPQGPSILLYPLTYAGTQNASMRFITEWQSPNFHNYFFFVFGASILVLMVTPTRRPVDWALGLLVVALTAMSLQSARVIPFYALAVAPFLGARLAGLGMARVGAREPGDPTPPPVPRPSSATPWNWLLLALCLAILTATPFISDRAQLGPEPRTTDYPQAGAEYLRRSGIEGRMFNSYDWGGYLIWAFYPERRVFIDGRADMYGDPFIEEYMELHHVRPGWSEVLEKYDVEVALVESSSRMATLLSASGRWQEAFRGEIESVFVRVPQESGRR